MYSPLSVADIVTALNRYDSLIADGKDEAERNRLETERERWQAHFDRANQQYCPPPSPPPSEEQIKAANATRFLREQHKDDPVETHF